MASHSFFRAKSSASSSVGKDIRISPSVSPQEVQPITGSGRRGVESTASSVQPSFFARPDCHVHGFLPGQGEWATHLLFRDFLRADEGGRATYTRFKLRTAESVGWDRAAYQQAKDRYVTEFLPEAEAWAQGCGWRCPAIG